MTELSEGQYELDGYVFGLDTAVRLLSGGDITTHNPVAEPASETTNKALQYAAAVGVDA